MKALLRLYQGRSLEQHASPVGCVAGVETVERRRQKGSVRELSRDHASYRARASILVYAALSYY